MLLAAQRLVDKEEENGSDGEDELPALVDGSDSEDDSDGEDEFGDTRPAKKASTMLVLLRKIMKKKSHVIPTWVLRLPLAALWGQWIFAMSIRRAK